MILNHSECWSHFPDLTFALQSNIAEFIGYNYADRRTRELTAVGVNAVVVQEPNPEVVQNGGFVEEAESRQVIFALQDVRVAQRWEVRWRRHRVIHLLSVRMEVRRFWGGGSLLFPLFRSTVTFPSESWSCRCLPPGL